MSLALDGNAPAFSAYVSGAQTINSGSWTKVACNVEEFDTNSNYDTSAYRFTPTVAGYYQINGAVQFDGTVDTAVARCAIYKNGSGAKNGVQVHASINKVISSNVSCEIYMNGSTDYVELYAYQDSGSGRGVQNDAASSYFQAFLARSPA